MSDKRILVVGGAGFIGSHMVLMLKEAGFHPLIIDNLATGHLDAALGCEIIIGDMADNDLLTHVFTHYEIGAVMHFASCIEVGESVDNPLKYYQNNVAATLNLIQAMIKFKVDHLVFSSSAAVYGEPQSTLIGEAHALLPINPYGRSKLMVEQIIQDVASAHSLNFAILRYFNAAGADPAGRLGERHQPESHLIPLILQAAMNMRPSISIFGDDYPTPDGTCVRDYIHVTDICSAHLLALRALYHGEKAQIYNLGTGRGYSVMEVINAARHVTGMPICVHHAKRRHGDPAVLVADASLARKILKWEPRYSAIEEIIAHAWWFNKKIMSDQLALSS